MDIIERALRRLFPGGHAFRLPGSIGQVISAIALSTERLRTFFLTIPTESLPVTAVMTLPAWYQALGLNYDQTKGQADQQAQCDAAWSQSGGQYLNYLNAQIQKELPQVYIAEVLFPGAPPANDGTNARMNIAHVGIVRMGAPAPSMIYNVLGTVPDRGKYNRLLAILARIAPLHLLPYINITITSELFIARMNIAQMNNARVGKGS